MEPHMGNIAVKWEVDNIAMWFCATRIQKRLMVDDAYHYDRIGIKSSAMEPSEAFISSLTPFHENLGSV
ncbi:hypothetical protein SAY86_012914 [Trapa natans]|uniref:Uncharacterized protein n=1 Tax=Trapa natans TaxID=22666 RepID=A0AAN7MDN5_TRANT|nr:hypothetical protein SAY86_012914 [Trapa natans]